MDKVYRVYKESLLNPQRLMDDLGVDENLDSLGMGIIRKELDLTNDEKQYLLAVERGDVPSTRQFLGMAQQTGININCVDPLGRTALLIAIENENIEMIELLLSYGVELGDALLHAISEENVEAVELLLNHEVNSKGEEALNWTAPSSSFTPDITPIILAAHRDNYEIIKILLDRGYRIPKPHNARCSCKDCVDGSSEDSLRHSRSRINAYKALASPSLIALSSKDPILTSFELSVELRRLSRLENEFKADYEKLATKCQDFAVDLLEQTRGSRELSIVLNHDTTASGVDEAGSEKMKLSRLKLAVKYKQKKFVSHPNCQQLLASLWYDGLPGFRRRSIISKMAIIFTIAFFFPLLSLIYLIAPTSSIGRLIRKPFIKFIVHQSSYILFLLLLILVSQRVEIVDINGEDSNKDKVDREMRGSPASLVEWIILAYVAGLIWAEIKQLWDEGALEYIYDMWNILDFTTNSLYIATFTLRLLAYFKVQEEKKRTDPNANLARENWPAYDPSLVAEAMFAAANIFSSLKLIYMFTVNPYLGPLQISLGRMIMDILKFFVIFALLLFSFACGLNHVYWYYAAVRAKECSLNPDAEDDPCNRKYRSFANLFEIVQTLYWAIFGLVDLDHAELSPRFKHEFTEFVGKLMFGTYSWIALVVLLNMLIAMMSNSYQNIYSQADEEWKFARSKLWISYFDDSGTLPAPFNTIPSPKTFYYILCWLKSKLCACSKQQKHNRWQSIKKIVKKLNEREIRYQSVMHDLIRRYIMNKQRGPQKGEGVTEDDINELKQDVSSFRFELLEILRNNGMKTPNPSQPKPTNRRLSRKRSTIALDRLRRSFSFQTASPKGSVKSLSRDFATRRSPSSESVSSNPNMAEVDVTIEKQLLRRTHSNGIPETILEEEERIRRESLKPVNGDLLRRDPHDEGRDATKEGASDSKSLDEADDSLLRELQMRQNGDEGLGESLDRNSELSDRDSMSRNGSSNVVEMQPAGDSVVGTSLHPQTTSDGDEPPESPGLTFLDPESARRVTFM
ncbi:LOW QUALITY PROTEIN: transient receptor potential-gamma protein-like [Pomacea canaliculata]|uniref:LOW QUALITY PROTEIN: transient receptor potential-gamma protein-like n=1 Tax=Pomacea canaliculata TaxID=400727 RepID=UPI000D732A76|nr:LOW QUALITY PROTEIN: transient receptor potential-gamma protein-like [Pomacea canaliculata]